MLYSQSPSLTADDTTFGGLERDLDVRSDPRTGRRRTKPPADSPYSYRFGEGHPGEGQPAVKRPSIGRRMFRTLIRFSMAVLIGVGATLGWQSYGNEIREMLIFQAPTLGMLLPVPTTKWPVVAAASTDQMQLAPLASTLDAVRRSVDQLAAKQDQLARNIASLRAAEDDVRQKASSRGFRFSRGPGPADRIGAAVQTAAGQDRNPPAASGRVAIPALIGPAITSRICPTVAG